MSTMRDEELERMVASEEPRSTELAVMAPEVMPKPSMVMRVPCWPEDGEMLVMFEKAKPSASDSTMAPVSEVAV